MNFDRDKASSRSGMALVIVLGLIALLIISSVTFGILMRVERASSANSRNTIMARQVAKSALAYAIAAIDEEVGTNSYPVWYDEDNVTKPYWITYADPKKLSANITDDPRVVHFWKDTFGSVDHRIPDVYSARRAPAGVMSYALEKYLPQGIRPRAYARRYIPRGDNGADPFPRAEKDVVSPEWIALMADAESGADAKNVIGRFAFLAFNTTGYLDLSSIVHGGGEERALGRSAAEIQLPKGFFGSGMTSDTFKNKNKSVPRFESVAEIIERNGDQTFAQGSTYRAFSYDPPEKAPEKSDAENDRTSDGIPFTGKVFIGGDDASKCVQHLKKHKARIMKAFYDSGLTASTDEYDAKSVSESACDECGTAAYTLPAKYNSEQALWAYLGLIDYVDDDDEPEGDNEYEKFARPATENMPLFNGFMATVRIVRKERAKEKEIKDLDGNVIDRRKYFDGEHVDFEIEFNGKVVFANRSVDPNAEVFDDEIEGKMGFVFNGYDALWQKFADVVQNADGVGDTDAGVHMEPVRQPFNDGASVGFSFKADCDEIALGTTIADPTDAAQKDEALDKAAPLPDTFSVGAAGATFSPRGDVLRRVPASEDGYEDVDFETRWLTATLDTKKEGFKTDKKSFSLAYEEEGDKVYSTEAKAVAGGGEDYTLKRRVVNLILWGEMIDPRHSHFMARDYLWSDTYPRVAMVSHTQGDEDNFPDYSISRMKKHGIDFNGAKKLLDMMGNDQNANDNFVTFANKFKGDPGYFDGYFTCDDDWMSGYSSFQKFMLTSANALKTHFMGHVDGSRLGAVNVEEGTDDIDSQWHAAYTKNAPLDTIGELGYLPIGPFASIRLCGFDGEQDAIDDVDGNISLFNALPVDQPFHTVLDFFTRRRATSGLVNLNATDPVTIAAVFNDMPINTDVDTDWDRLSEDDALELAGTLFDSWQEIGQGRPFARLSELGWAFELKADHDTSFLPDNRLREAAVRNSCGLFTTRGQTFTILLRGEAYSPFYGKTDVKDEAGTTLASRLAIAQIWRDSEPDSDGVRPVFVQFFKILDE